MKKIITINILILYFIVSLIIILSPIIIDIYKSTKFLRKANDEEIIDTVLHEIAHAIVGPGQGHNLIWKKKAIEIGCSGKIYHNVEFSKPKWIKFCSEGCWETKCFRKKNNLICKYCRSNVEYRIND